MGKPVVRSAVTKEVQGPPWMERVTDSFCGFLWEARKGNVRVDPL